MHQHRKTSLRVPILAILAALFAALLFGGVTHAADEAQSAAQSTTAQSVNTTAPSSSETQSSSTTAAVAVTADNDAQPANGGHACIHQDISPGEISTDFKASDGSSEITAYEAVEFSIVLELEEGHCGGDSATITVPSELGTDGDPSPIPMTTPEGVTIGHAVYDGHNHTVTITLTNEVEVSGRQDFHASAWWKVHMASTLVPGETRELTWDIDGVVRRTTIHVGTCDGCSQLGAGPSKWGSVDGNAQHVTIVLPTATQDDQTFVITDVLTSPGQSFNCAQLLTGRMGVYTKAGPWGQPQYERFIEPGVTSCTSDKVTLSATLNAGEKARVELNILVKSTDPGPWTDSVSIASQDKSWEVSTKVVRRESGGNAGFDPANPPTPEPSPTPTPAPTPAPTPTPAPSPSTTITPAPSPSPSAPTPTPSVTTPAPTPSAPSPSATPSTTPAPTPSTTPSATSSATPSTAPSPMPTPSEAHQRKLAVTGTDGSAIAGAVALLALGSLILRARRRQAARSKG